MHYNIDTPNNMEFPTYLSDKDLAELVRMSPSWVRKQRHLRFKGENHSLTIEPIYIGSSPRYLNTTVQEWLKGLLARH